MGMLTRRFPDIDRLVPCYQLLSTSVGAYEALGELVVPLFGVLLNLLPPMKT